MIFGADPLFLLKISCGAVTVLQPVQQCNESYFLCIKKNLTVLCGSQTHITTRFYEILLKNLLGISAHALRPNDVQVHLVDLALTPNRSSCSILVWMYDLLLLLYFIVLFAVVVVIVVGAAVILLTTNTVSK